MKIGFENEYFVKNEATGTYMQNVPLDLPHDAAGTLVEVRSDAADDPALVLKSFKERLAELTKAAADRGLSLVNLATCDKVLWDNQPETAGFHIHFSNPAWTPLGWPKNHYSYNWRTIHDNPPKEIAAMLEQLDGVFKKEFTDVRRHIDAWRYKKWGWEYRRLPATVEPGIVAKRLTELYYPKTLKKASGF